MATTWSTFPVEFKGGLISNLSPLQQGINALGSATVLQNMEPDRKGGYTKIKGFDKFSSTEVPGEGVMLGLRSVDLTKVVAARKLDSAAITALADVTADVNGAVSASTNIVLDGNDGTIEVGMTVTGTGISGTVKVSTVTDQNNIVLDTAVTLADDVELSFGVLNTTHVGKTALFYGTGTTWSYMAVSANTNGGKMYHASYNFDGDDKTVFVDGINYPVIYNSNSNTARYMTAADAKINTDVQAAELVCMYKNAAFYSKGSTIYFTAPFTTDNFSAADGAGSISVGYDVTGMIVFRDQLIIFTSDSVKRLVGNTQVDFQLLPISDKIGCVSADTVQEFGGDIIYLAPDGIRLLSATDRIGDFGLDVASDKIYKDADELIGSSNIYASVILREKGQYRLFSYISGQDPVIAKGVVATKFIAQGAGGINWSTTSGIKAYIADSIYSGNDEAIFFAEKDGYVYQMEKGNSFGDRAENNINAVYESPYMPVTDPEVRKTAYKLTLYTDPTGTLDLNFRLLFDFDSGGDTRVVQPPSISIGAASTGASSGVFLFGAANSLFGTAVFGGKLKKVYDANLIGSFHTVAMRIVDDSTNPPFTLDSAVLQYRQNDRQ